MSLMLYNFEMVNLHDRVSWFVEITLEVTVPVPVNVNVIVVEGVGSVILIRGQYLDRYAI